MYYKPERPTFNVQVNEDSDIQLMDRVYFEMGVFRS